MKQRASTGKAVWLTICGLVAGLAAFLLVYSAASNDDRFLGVAGALLPTSLTVAAAVYAVQTWTESRRATNEKHYRETLESFFLSATDMDTVDMAVDRDLRIRIAAWASPEMVNLMAARSDYIHLAGNGLLPREQQASTKLELGWFTAELISRARADVGMEAVSPESVFDALWPRIDGLDGNEARDRVAEFREARASKD